MGEEEKMVCFGAMTSSCDIDNIPDDLLHNILGKLRVKDLLRFKSVCKHWCSLIEDPAFVKMHLERSSKDIFIYSVFSYFCQSDNRVVLRHHLHSIEQGIVDFDNLCRINYDVPLMAYFASHCNGLYASPCFGGYCIRNPSTRESIPLPHTSHKFDPLSVAIGFDPSRNKYKVVAMGCRRPKKPGKPFVCHVFTLGTSSWRKINSKPPVETYSAIVNEQHITVNGTLYWGGTGWDNDNDIISFDLKNEQFGVNIPQPKKLSHLQYRLLEYGGRLCMFRKDEASPNTMNVYNLWMLEEHGWLKQHVFSLNKIYILPDVILRNGEILTTSMEDEQHFLHSYNLQSRVSKKIEIHGMLSRRYTVINYSESLISLKNIMNTDLIRFRSYRS